MLTAAASPSDDWSLQSRYGRWFLVALIVLLFACVGNVVRSERFQALPKPGDGPVYENIAFQLSQGRGFWVDWQDPLWRIPYEQTKDRADYASYLTEDQSMPMTGRPPAIPLVIATIYSVAGRGAVAFATIRILLAISIAVACALAVANAAKVLSSGRWGKRRFSTWSITSGCAGSILLAASNRTLLSYGEDFLTEPLALLLTQFLVTALLWLQSSSACEATAAPVERRIVVLVSATLALMVLARSFFVTWLPGIGVLLLVIFPSRVRWRTMAAIMLMTLLFLAPWWTRNCLVLQRFMPLGTQGPITMLGGYCEDALTSGGDWQPEPEQSLRRQLARDPSFSALPSDVQRELVVVRESRRMVQSWIGENHHNLPRLFLMRVTTHWNPYTGKSLVWRVLILIGALWLLIHSRRESWILVGLPVMNTLLIAAMYTTGGRFLVPLYGVLFSLSAIGIAVIVELTTGPLRKS